MEWDIKYDREYYWALKHWTVLFTIGSEPVFGLCIVYVFEWAACVHVFIMDLNAITYAGEPLYLV